MVNPHIQVKLYTYEKNILNLVLICIALSIINIFSCFDNCDIDNKSVSKQVELKYQTRKIVYEFIDSSVPPEYHRSYTITVSFQKVKIIVDSYGEILAEREYDIKKEQFEYILESFFKNQIGNENLGDEDGCTGGTTEKLSLLHGEKEIFNGIIYHCGGKDFGNMRGNIKNFAEDLVRLIPNFKKLLK